MALPDWPLAVPYEVADDWQMPQMFASPLATDMAGNNTRLRQQPGSDVAQMTYPLKPLTLEEWSSLSMFLRSTCSNGTSRWTMPVMTGVEYETKTVQLDGGKSPTIQRRADFVNVVLPLKVYGV